SITRCSPAGGNGRTTKRRQADGRPENRLKSTVLWQRGLRVRVFRVLPPAADAPIALTIGNFDGVHRGHQAMLSRLVEAADDLALPPGGRTYEPHPREFFSPASAPPRLSTLRGKLERLEAYGVKRVYVARFDAAFAH